MKFIYVFSEEDKNALLSRGFILLKEYKGKKDPKYWVFENASTKDLIFESMENYAFSDTLSL